MIFVVLIIVYIIYVKDVIERMHICIFRRPYRWLITLRNNFIVKT